MELLLNAVWLTLASTALLTLLWNHRSRSGSHSILLSLGALVCSSALLFPSISITDDLHLDVFVIEDSNSTKRIATAIAHAAPAAPVAWFGIFIFVGFFLTSPRLTSARACGWRIAEGISQYEPPVFIRPLPGRAPPLIA